MFSKFNSNKVTSSTTQDVLIVDFNNRQPKPICHAMYHTLSIAHKGKDQTTRQTAANKVRQKLSIFLMSI